MTELADLGALLIVHAEDGGRVGECSGAYPDFLASRPPESEVSAIELVVLGTGDRLPDTHPAPVLRGCRRVARPFASPPRPAPTT